MTHLFIVISLTPVNCCYCCTYLLTGCPLEIGDVPFDTKEFNFTSHLNAAREGFTGRLWLYHDLESLLLNSQGHSDGGVVVVGEPGAGKSALSAQLICSRSSNPYIHKRIIGYHLCKYSDKATQDPGRFVRNLVDLIARRVPEYGMLIHNSSFIPRILQQSCLRDPFDCFEQAVATPLRQLKNELQYYFVVIDALDECSSDDSGTSIVQFIRDNYKKLPKWILLVVTSRNDSTVLKLLSSFPKLYLSSIDGRNLQDIEIFITKKIIEDAPFLGTLKVMLGLSSSDEVSYLTNKLLRQSQGNFHFAKEMLHFWKNDPHSVDLNKLPKTIGEQYERYLRRAYGSREKFKPALAILEILVAAYEPIQISDLFDVLKVRETIDYEYDFVYTLKGLSHFIRYGENNTVNLFHLSFIEWLTSKENLGNRYYVSRTRGHRRLAEYYLNLVKKTPNLPMNIYRLAQHISSDDHNDDHQGEFTSIEASHVNTTIDNENRTLLHLAAAKSDHNVLLLLRPAFQNIDCEDSHGFTPAFVAAMNGLVQNVDFLINEGANIEHRTRPPQGCIWGDPIKRFKTAFWNSTMMHAAASGGHSGVVKLLLRRNASFHDVNGVNLTAIQLAAEKGHLKIVQILYERGAQCDHLSLQYAAYGGHVDVVTFLLNVGVVDHCMRCDGSFYWVGNQTRCQVASSNAKSCILSDDSFKIFCQSALHLAVARNHTKVAKLLLSQEDEVIHCRDFTGRTPLHEAVRQNHALMAELLMKNGAKVSRRCRNFQNVTSFDNLDLEDKSSRHTKCHLNVEEIEKYNKDICPCGSTPFLLAARYGHIDVAAMLMRHGARTDDVDCQGATPLHVAACHGHYAFIKWLVSQRPSLHIHLRSKNQSTPLHSSAICKNNKDIKPLIEMGASIYETDQYGMTPLHYSVLNAFENEVTFLLHTTTCFETFYDTLSVEHTFTGISEDDITVARDEQILERKVALHFQCLKLLAIAESADVSYIDKGDDLGRTTLHLAAQSGDECSVMHLLRRGARTDSADNSGRTPLDVAIEFAPEELKVLLVKENHNNVGLSYRTTGESFDLLRASNLRYHNSVADILLSREAYLAQTCSEGRTSPLHKAFESEKPVIADLILSKGGLLSCKDEKGRTPLLIYLQNGGKWLDVVLNRFEATINIECGKPFNISEFHLAAFRKPTAKSDNFMEQHYCDEFQCYSEDGPLVKAIKAHPRGFKVIDECRDEEGYTALHRAAQGGNVLVLENFLSWGADPLLLTPQGHTALDHAIMASIYPLSFRTRRNNSEKAADLLLRATTRVSRLDVGCNSSEAKLTIYHLAAYAGLSSLVKTLLKDRRLLGVDVNCSNVHGITPLYLAKLHVGSDDVSDGEKDHWQEIVDFIEKNGGNLTYPNRQAELNLLYNHLFGSHPNRFILDSFEDTSELYYESDNSQCRESDLDHYNTGTMINPYMKAVHVELMQILKAGRVTNMNSQLIPREFIYRQILLKTLADMKAALKDLSRLSKDVLQGMDRAKMEVRRRRKRNTSNTTNLNFPKFIMVHLPSTRQRLLTLWRKAKQNEQTLRENRFRYESTKAIMSHHNKHLKDILHKHSGILGDTRNIIELLEKYEESALCLDEIFQAKFIKLKFHNYVSISRAHDFLSFWQTSLDETEFTFKRSPLEWTAVSEMEKSTLYWNQAVKFLYQKATQRDTNTFDYLQVLSLGRDKHTRIPLNVNSIYRLAGGF